MADPFSIVAGTVSLLDCLYRCGSYLKKLHDSAAHIEEDVAALSQEIQALQSLNQSIKETFETHGSRTQSAASRNAKSDLMVENLWRSVGTWLSGCEDIVRQLTVVVEEIVGKDEPSKSFEKVKALQKALRKDKRTEKMKELRSQLTNNKNSLQVTMLALNLSYTLTSQDSTDQSLGHLSADVQRMQLRLQAEIADLKSTLTTGDNDRLLGAIRPAAEVASMASLNKHFDIPQSVSSIFTGRDDLLRDLQKAFDVFQTSREPRTVQRRFIVHGLGGSGKTQFCCRFAQDNRNSFWGVFYVDATSSQTAEHSFRKIAKIGGIEPSEGSYQRASKQWLSELEHPWLLLIDNADDPSYPLENYFPYGERGCVLVTTRVPGNRVHGTVGVGSYRFETLARQEASNLLLKAAGKRCPWEMSEIEAAELIAAALGFLPLALVHAGKTIMDGICSLGNYIEHYNQNWRRIRQARRKAGYREDEENMNVYTSYDMNLKNLEESASQEAIDALQLLKMFSFLHPQNIRVDFLVTAATNPFKEKEQQEKDAEEQARLKVVEKNKSFMEYVKERLVSVAEFVLADRGPPVLPALLRESDPSSLSDLEIRLRKALKVLSQMSLITHNETADNYSMHPLVHTWVRERPEMTTAEQALWCQAAKTVLAQCIILPPHGSSEKDEDMRRSLLPHVSHVQRCQQTIDINIKQNQKSRNPFLSWITSPESTFGRQQALEYAKFSRVYFECGMWKEAEKLQVAVMDFVVSKRGPDHPVSIMAMLFLSATYWSQSETNKAAELQSRVAQAALRAFGPNHPRTHKILDTLGSSRCFQGRFKEALELHTRAIEGMTKTPPKNPEDIYIAKGNLGRVLWRYFRYDEAREIHMEAVEGLTRVLGPKHLQTLIAMEDLAISYLDCGEKYLEDAHKLIVEVLEQRRTRLGKEQPYTLLAICSLARVENARGNSMEAERLFREAIPVAERTLGVNHFGTLAGKVYFAQVLVRQKRYEEAEEVLVKVVEKQRYASAARDDGDHPDRIFALWQLVLCYELHGKHDFALERIKELERAVGTIGGQGLGKLHPFAQRLENKRRELESAKKGSAGADLGLARTDERREAVDPPPPYSEFG